MRTLAMVLVAWGWCLIGAIPLHAQQGSAPQVFKILGISVEGNTLADPTAVIANSGLRVGDEITYPGDQIPAAVRKLWSLRIFEDIQIAVDRKVGEGVFLVIRVKELPRFEQALINGNDEISTEDIEKKIGLIKGQVVPPQETVRLRRQLEAMYEEEGYLLADVRVTTEPADTGASRVNLRVDIDEGKEVEVEEISFEGNKAYSDDDLSGEMDEISTSSWWQFWSSAKFKRDLFEKDKKQIVQFYRRNGYRDAQVLGDSLWYSEDREKMYILVRVFEGPQYRIRSITWEGNTVYQEPVLNARLDLFPGDVYDLEKFEKNLRGNEDQTDVASLYLDNGYLRFYAEPIEERVGDDQIDLRIKVYEMNQFRIGQINIKGNTKTWEKVIRRELYTRPGDYFSRAAIIRSIRQLAVLNYFNPEKILPDYTLVDDKTVDLSYEVEEKSSDNVNASIGYSGAYGVTGALGFTITNFSISQPLTGGAGQVLNFELQFGEAARFRTFSIGFTEPWLMDTPTLLGVSLYDTRQAYLYDLTQTGGSLRLGRRLRWPDDYFRGDLILRAQSNNVSDGRGIYVEGKTTQVTLQGIITRNSIDNPIFPSRGSNISLSVEVSGGPFLPGNINFHKWMLRTEWFVPLFGGSRLALYFGSDFGVLQEINNSIVPPIDLFFMGGTGLGAISTTPLRGYDDQSVGPRNALGQIVGGKAMTRQTIELRLALSINPVPIYVLGFLEGGNVFESFSKADFFSLRRSAGFGARIQVQPIGMLGFDYGYGFDDVSPRDGRPDGWHFHFVFGKGF
jgi:outer membrane protein insertion porin family